MTDTDKNLRRHFHQVTVIFNWSVFTPADANSTENEPDTSHPVVS